MVSRARVDRRGLDGLTGSSTWHTIKQVRPIAAVPAPLAQRPLWEESARSTLASGAGEVDEAMLDVGANQLDAQFISDVEALRALRQ